MKLIRLAVATGLITAGLGLAPASATECKPGKPCTACHVNWEISKDDPRPVVCYI